MKQLVIILSFLFCQSSFAQEKAISRNIKTAFEGLWQSKNKYQTNTVEIGFERDKSYALFKDMCNGMAPARVLQAQVKGNQLVILAQWQKTTM